MAPALRLRLDEQIGLVIAIMVHAAMVAVLLIQPTGRSITVGESGRITVSLSSNDGEMGATMAASEAQAETFVDPKPVTRDGSIGSTRDRGGKQESTRNGDSEFDNAFDEVGTGSGASTAAVNAEIDLSIRGEVLGPWNRCGVTGVDLDRLSVVVAFSLDRQGKLVSIGQPEVKGQNASNRAQAQPLGECAVRAIRLAAPFTDLPSEHYDKWKSWSVTLRKE